MQLTNSPDEFTKTRLKRQNNYVVHFDTCCVLLARLCGPLLFVKNIENKTTKTRSRKFTSDNKNS